MPLSPDPGWGRAVPVLGRAVAALGLLAALVVASSRPGAGQPTPPTAGPELFAGQPAATLSASGGWSWFQSPRADLTGCELLVGSTATGTTADGPARAGDVDVITRSLADGTTWVDTLAEGLEVDDHDSASVLALPGGRVMAAYTKHNRDAWMRSAWRGVGVRHWTSVPPVAHPEREVTYSNLVHLSDDGGAPALYNLFRGGAPGTARDPNVLRSTNLGATWAAQGPLVHAEGQRPYARYADDGVSRIDVALTNGHPNERDEGTSLYHGYLEGRYLYGTADDLLGPVGGGVDPQSLTPIYVGDDTHRPWVIDLVQAPSGPVVVFSVRDLSVGLGPLEENTYWYARWDGSDWVVEELGLAGRSLYSAEPYYTGGMAIDPADASHVVVSADVHPGTGQDLGNHELFDAVTSDGGSTWTYTRITTNTVDDLRPIIPEPTGTARALVWMAGTYTTFTDYSTSVQAIVDGGPDGHCPPPAYAPGPHPFSGDFDGDGVLDYFHYRPGPTPDTVFWGDGDRTVFRVDGTFTPIPVRFAGNPDQEGIIWSNPAGQSYRWDGTGHSFRSRVYNGWPRARPVVGDFNGDGADDTLHYRPGSEPDVLQLSVGSGYEKRTVQVNGTYQPLAGDLTGDGIEDVFWYRPGTANDPVWRFDAQGRPTGSSMAVNGTYQPAVGDLDGNGTADIVWSGPTGKGYRWSFTPGATPVAVGTPIP